MPAAPIWSTAILIQVDGSWSEYRWTLPSGALQAGAVQAQLASTDSSARFAVDHLLLLPRSSETLAQLGD